MFQSFVTIWKIADLSILLSPSLKMADQMEGLMKTKHKEKCSAIVEFYKSCSCKTCVSMDVYWYFNVFSPPTTQFVLDYVMDILLDDGLYVRQPGQPLCVCPPIVSHLKTFLQSCVKVLPHAQLKGKHICLLKQVDTRKSWAVIIDIIYMEILFLPVSLLIRIWHFIFLPYGCNA